MIEFKNVRKVYPGNNVAVDNMNLSFDSGKFIVFIGTSGSGKTTCLRMINRMIDVSSGSIYVNGKDIKEMDEVLLRRHIGYVIQQIGLMPHMTVYENIVMVCRLLKWPEDKMRQTAERLIKKVKLPLEYLEYYPSELSGGQKQRIGVIRALAAEQEIILMDEPFGALDPITRTSLQQLIKQLQEELGKTVVFVTHDMDEALSVADKIAIMDKGKLVQFDTPENILRNPANKFVEELIGEDRLTQASFIVDTVETIMKDKPITATQDTSVLQALDIMRTKHVDMLLIVNEDNTLLGHIDIFDIEKTRDKKRPITDLVKDTVYIKKSTIIRDAIYYINTLGLKNLPVVDESGILLGIVTRASVVDAVYNGMWGDYSLDILKEETIQTTSEEDEIIRERIRNTERSSN